jgi:hypothetical protein
MITGDKAETAVAIGRMCGLLKPDHELELLLKLTGDSLRQKLDDLVHFFSRTSFHQRPSQATVSSSLTQVLRRTFSPAPSESFITRASEPSSVPQRDSMTRKTDSLMKREENSFASQFLPAHLDDDSKSLTASYRSVLTAPDLLRFSTSTHPLASRVEDPSVRR